MTKAIFRGQLLSLLLTLTITAADFKLELTGAYRKRTYCVQYRETDFNFVSRLMESEGIGYYFRHTDGHDTMVMEVDR